MKHPVIVLLLLLPTYALAEKVELILHKEKDPWPMFEKYKNPVISWENEIMVVQCIVHDTGSSLVVTDTPGLNMKSNDIQLCYKTKPIQYESGQAIPAVAMPIYAEFKVRGLQKQNYNVEVIRCEQKP